MKKFRNDIFDFIHHTLYNNKKKTMYSCFWDY